MNTLGQLGFSYVGLLFLLMLYIPNIIWLRRQPGGYEPQNENRTLRFLERVGQALVTVTALCFTDLNWRPWDARSLWLVAALALMLMYEAWWIKYFRSPKRLADFYSSFWGVPVAGATLPVLAFLLLGIYGRVLLLIVSALILGIGHIGIHLQHLRSINTENTGER